MTAAAGRVPFRLIECKHHLVINGFKIACRVRADDTPPGASPFQDFYYGFNFIWKFVTDPDSRYFLALQPSYSCSAILKPLEPEIQDVINSHVPFATPGSSSQTVPICRDVKAVFERWIAERRLLATRK